MAVVRKALTELRRAKRLGTIGASIHEKHFVRFELRLARLKRKAMQFALPNGPAEV